MNKTHELNFIANAGLKDIVGKDLITNKNLALIELIKNSKDADSNVVDLIFKNTNDINNPDAKIIIRDFGTGMTFEDIKSKWLNIAYSTKKHSVNSKGKAYAGNKGVGRFSCDRLGEKLQMYTLSTKDKGYKVDINWTDFEVDDINTKISDPIINITEMDAIALEKIFGHSNIINGTCLIVSGLRDNWDYKELKNLKRELEKFVITPNSEVGTEKFDVNLSADFLNDKEAKEINGKIENKIFQELDFRTASIDSEISADGKKILTSLFHDGKRILTITEKNAYSELKSIKTKLFYMGRAQRIFFGRKIGYSSHDFGSIFLFLNGFRIYPYGEESNDWLRLDQRKAQGYNRFLGTRELMGYVSIEDTSNKFRPVSAREGLFNNQAFTQLSILEQSNEAYGYGFMSKTVRKFEKFVIEGLNWDRLTDEQLKDEKNLDEKTAEFVDINQQLISSLSSLINFGIKKENFISVDFNIEYFKEMAKSEREACQNFYNELKSKFEISSVNNIEELNKIIPKIKEVIKEKEQIIEQQQVELAQAEEAFNVAEEKRVYAENQRKIAEQEKDTALKKVEVEKRRSSFLENLSNPERTLDALITHIIKQVSFGIETDVHSALAKYYRDNDSISKEKLVEILERVAFSIALVKESTIMATKADFDLKQAWATDDLYSFIEDYYREFLSKNNNIKIKFTKKAGVKRKMTFKPTQLCVFIVNIIDNADKNHAKNLEIFCDENEIRFINNGDPLTKVLSQEEFFQKGTTTTRTGSGLGLYHCKIIADKLGAKLSLENNSDGIGVTLKMEFLK